MVQADLPFSRLAAAWMPGSINVLARSHPEAPPAAQGKAGAHAATDLRVLFASAQQHAPALLAGGPLPSPGHAGRFYRFDSVLVSDLHTLEQHCHALSPHVVVVDAGLTQHGDAAALQQLRWRLPATDWLLFGDAPLHDAANLALLGQMRGCIGRNVSTEHLARALDAVASGRLWFPRAVLESLYLSLLRAGEPRLGSQPAAAGDLTARESEVLALLRHGLTNRQIAERLCISANTVKKHIASVFEKRGLHHRRQEVD